MRVQTGSSEVAIPGRREGILLAVLLLHANHAVAWERIAEAMWADRPPRDVTGQVQGIVYRLRRRLGTLGASDAVIVTEPGGYRARVAPHDVDLLEFRRLRDEARTAARDGRPDEARDRYRAGLELWRGSALGGVDSDVVRQTADALEEEHVQALEECIESELAIGGAGGLVAELTDLVRQHPYREGLRGQLMCALYRGGRQADALDAYRRIRQLLHDELGTEPGSELQQLHHAILKRDPTLDVPQGPAEPPRPAAGAGSAAPAPRELPATAAGFTGRHDALEALDRLLPAAQNTAESVVVAAIAGAAGVGKTALAVHWAHRVTDRFPDGQIYLDLRGFSAVPAVRPADALTSLLRSLGTPADQIPTDPARAAAHYRSLLARRRLLVVLDNAASVEHVRPLLPGSPGCLVLVTSRDRLGGLVARDGASRLTLDVLTPDEAQALLARLLSPGTVAEEPEATAEIAEACAYLPLALRIAAAHMTDHSYRTVADYAATLHTADRITTLHADGDPESAVRAAFDTSYRSVPGEDQRLFRLLGLVPGPDFTAVAAAALAGVAVETAERLLDRLARAHLVEERAPGTYCFHDLLRLYARQLAHAEDDGEPGAATERLLGSYLHCAHRAVTLLYPHMLELPEPAASLPESQLSLDQPAAALSWLETERANLVAAVEYAASHGPRPLAWQIAGCLRRYFANTQHASDWQAVSDAALTAAREAGDTVAQAGAQLSAADLYVMTSRSPEAVERYRAALTLTRRADWVEGEATALANLGVACRRVGRLQEAADHLNDMLALSQRLGSLNGQAISSVNLGNIDRERGRLAEAVERGEHALALFGQLGHLAGKASAQSSLGVALHLLGQIDRARTRLATALDSHRELGNRLAVTEDLAALAAVLQDAGQLADALEYAQCAVAQGQEIGDPETHASAFGTLGNVQLQRGFAQHALDLHHRALDLAHHGCSPLAEAHALLGAAAAHLSLGQCGESQEHASRARLLADRTGYRVLRGQASTMLAEIHLRRHDLEQARAHAQRALHDHRCTGHRLGEARTLVTIGRIRRIRHETDGTEAARGNLTCARELYAEVGASVPDELSADS